MQLRCAQLQSGVATLYTHSLNLQWLASNANQTMLPLHSQQEQKQQHYL
jgi:hypothetical protein